MKVEIVLTNGTVITIEQINFLEQKELLKDTIENVLNNDRKYIYFNGNIFDKDLHINKQLIESIETWEVNK